MLEFLRTKNLALLQDMDLEFGPGLNVLTGETGAGKSFILRALGFLLGDKPGPGLVREKAEKAAVEALFILGGEECILRRELSCESGRSRFFINDKLSSQSKVAELRGNLILHTSQHGQQRLLSSAYQGKLLDSFLPDPTVLAAYNKNLALLQEVQKKREALAKRMAELSLQREFMQFQLEEIEKVAPFQGEEEELLAKKQAHKNAALTARSAADALSCLHDPGAGVIAGLGEFARHLEALSKADPTWNDDTTACEEFISFLHDTDSRLREEKSGENGNYNQEEVEKRLYELAKLRRKLGRSLDEILNFQAEIEENFSFLDSCTLEEKQLLREEEELAKTLAKNLESLNKARQETAKSMTKALVEELHGLGFDKGVQVEFCFTGHNVYEELCEQRARLYWIPNPGQPPQPLDKIASGGELSRFLLALTGLISSEHLPSLLFDEVDAGVGGLTLNAVARRIQELAKKQQVLLITHWPQLAAKADRHYHVYKEISKQTTTVICTPLQGEDIFNELVRMAGGGTEGQALARELVNND